jgi:hypothetical protein
VHDVHTLSAVAVHTVLYCPVGQVKVLQGLQVWLLLKYPVLHLQSHASAPYGLPADTKVE